MIKSNKRTWATLGAVLLASGLQMPMAHAQSADALLDKLVDKGVLTVKEANDLRQQTDLGFAKALQTKNAMPDWVNQMRIYGDVRGRYELFRTENTAPGPDEPNKPRDRFRYRIRVGAVAMLKDNFEAGFRLTSGDPVGSFGGNPLSGNSTAQDNGSKKGLYVDLAYGKWTPIHAGPWMLGATIGKMENPFVNSDMVWDPDYTPEGAAIQGSYAFNASHSLKWSGAFFVLDEINQGATASNDPFLAGGQIRYDAKWTKKIGSTVGLGWYAISEKENLNTSDVPNVNGGNTRYATPVGKHRAGDLVYNYDPIVVDAAVTYTLDSFPLYPGAFPIRLGGEWMHNPGAPSNNEGLWGGAVFGKSGKKGTWEASYRYIRLEEDAQYEEFVNDDFGAYREIAFVGDTARGYRAGTGVEGHVMKVAYSLSDGFFISATWYLTDSVHPAKLTPASKATESGTHRVQIDATWKF